MRSFRILRYLSFADVPPGLIAEPPLTRDMTDPATEPAMDPATEPATEPSSSSPYRSCRGGRWYPLPVASSLCFRPGALLSPPERRGMATGVAQASAHLARGHLKPAGNRQPLTRECKAKAVARQAATPHARVQGKLGLSCWDEHAAHAGGRLRQCRTSNARHGSEGSPNSLRDGRRRDPACRAPRL